MKRFNLDDKPKPQGKRIQLIETVEVKCEHCGRLWEWTKKAGEMDYGYEPVALPFELPKVYPTDK